VCTYLGNTVSGSAGPSEVAGYDVSCLLPTLGMQIHIIGSYGRGGNMEAVSRRVGAFAATAIAAVTLFVAVGVQPAQAWGNAVVERHCGANAITSNQWANDSQTIKYGGTCAGTVGAAMRRSSGWHSRVWHSSWAIARGGSGNIGGAHWGCSSGCGQSNT
jgi:hypothetical protein